MMTPKRNRSCQRWHSMQSPNASYSDDEPSSFESSTHRLVHRPTWMKSVGTQRGSSEGWSEGHSMANQSRCSDGIVGTADCSPKHLRYSQVAAWHCLKTDPSSCTRSRLEIGRRPMPTNKGKGRGVSWPNVHSLKIDGSESGNEARDTVPKMEATE